MGIQLRIAGAALALALFAQAANAQDNTQFLPTIVVSSTAVPTPVNEIANSLTVITGQDMERDQRRTVTDALTAVPGLQVVQNGSSGAQTSVFIRGANSNQTKVIIDGIEVNDPSQNDAFDFGQVLLPELMSRVKPLPAGAIISSSGPG